VVCKEWNGESDLVLKGFVNLRRLAGLLDVVRSLSARKTMAPFAWNIRELRCYAVCLTAPETSHFVRNLVRVVFHFTVARNDETPPSGG